jgi:hypothetical protein
MEPFRVEPHAVMFECLVEEEHEVLQEAELSGELIQRTNLGGSSETMYFIQLRAQTRMLQ